MSSAAASIYVTLPPSQAPREFPVSGETAALRACPVFASSVPAALAALARGCTMRNLASGARLVPEGGRADHAFLVVRGALRAVRRGESGREVTVETFRPGDLVPDAILEGDAGLANDLLAAELSTVLAIPRDVFLAHLRLQPESGLALLRHLSARLRRQKDLSTGLVMTDVAGRVVRALRALAARAGEPHADGVWVRDRPTQQELANSIGACRETVSRIVSEMARQGLVTAKGRGLLVSRRLLEN